MNEVIIDGCNVAECKHRIEVLNDNGDVQCKIGVYRDDDVIIIPICKDNPDCYFKQLQRAKAEKKQSQEQLQNLWANATAERIKLEKENEKLKQALEDIKNLLYTAENTNNGDLYFELVSKAYMKCNEVLND